VERDLVNAMRCEAIGLEWNGTVYDDMGAVDQNEISSSVHTWN
jgi:hypothetical protein